MVFSACNVSDTNEYGEKEFYEVLESQNIQVQKGITYFQGYMPYFENYCYITLSGDDDYTFVTLKDNHKKYTSTEQTTYSFYVTNDTYYTLEVDADVKDYIEIDVNCY